MTRSTIALTTAAALIAGPAAALVAGPAQADAERHARSLRRRHLRLPVDREGRRLGDQRRPRRRARRLDVAGRR